MKKIVTAVIIVLLLGVGGFLGYGMYSADANSVPDGHFGNIKYVEADKSAIRAYVNDFYEVVYYEIGNSHQRYENGIFEAYGSEADEIRAGAAFVSDYSELYQYVVDYHNESPVPADMQETHEKLLESLYYADRIASGFSDAYEEGDLSQIEEWFVEMESSKEESTTLNPNLKKRKHDLGFDYLTNQ